MHTSIIYVTKKVIHWGANHPTVAFTMESEQKMSRMQNSFS